MSASSGLTSSSTATPSVMPSVLLLTRASTDDNTIWEVFYSMPVTDNITITPALFGADADAEDDIFGGVVKTTFKF